MSSTQTNQRFTDKNYKNWLITAESLSLVRSGLQPFVEKETETYHESLKKKTYLEGKSCTNNCNKKFCDLCNNWKKEISSNHAKPTCIYWDNCRPYLWPTDKWEVCKAYMPRGHRQHSEYAQFDVAAILNLMNFCKDFCKDVPEKYLTDVIQVRNSLMHSPTFTINDDDKNKHLEAIIALTKILENQEPELKSVPEKIKQFSKILHKTFSQDQCEVDGNQDPQTLNERQEVLNCEQQILKDKIEQLLLQFEGNEVENEKKEQGITALLEFLDKNKDLLENLGPEVSKLKEINEKVCLHEEQIKNLTVRVDNLENNTHGSIPTSSSQRYKNQLFEYCRAKNWQEPVFSMANEAQVSGSGYKAKVTVNKEIFTGKQVHKKLVDAHQEVAFIALQKLKLLDENIEESTASSYSSTGSIFLGKVSVFLDHEFESVKCNSEEDAVESAYKVLSRRFQHISAQAEGQTIKTSILEYFRMNGFPEPSENIVKNSDNTTICKLKVGQFTFNDKDGATKKKQAEQQAARVALHNLSGILGCSPGSDTEDHISLLNVAIEKLHLSPPVYDTEKKQRCSEPVARSINTSTTADELHLRSVSITTPSHQESLDSVPASKRQDSPDSTDPVFPNKKARIACPLTPELDELLNVFNLKPPHVKAQNRDEHNFKCEVEVRFDNFTCTDKKGNDSKKEAIRKIYLMFGRAVGIIDATADEKSASMLVKQIFSQKSLVPPQEEVNNSKPFCCSLKNITFTATYEEQGSSETEARLRALRRTLMAISPLFGYPSLAAADTLTDVESQLGSLLTGAGQKEPSISIKQLIKAGVQVSFLDYTVTCNCQKNKKAAHAHLSSRILRVFGEKTGSEGPSLRNSLDEWFQKHKLPPPVFKDTGEGHGAEATFSAELFCYSPDWEQDFKTATEKLCETLKDQFQFLTEEKKQ